MQIFLNQLDITSEKNSRSKAADRKFQKMTMKATASPTVYYTGLKNLFISLAMNNGRFTYS